MPKKYDQNILTVIAKQHAELFMRRERWDRYAKENELPNGKTFLKHFKVNSWTECVHKVFKDKLEEFVTNPNLPIKYNKETLTEIAIQHAEHFLNKRNWIKFAMDKDLPGGATYLRVFETGSWNQCIVEIFENEHKELVKSISLRKYRTKDELISIAKQYKAFFTNTTTWRKHAIPNKLPTVDVYERAFGSWHNAHRIIFGKESVPPLPAKDESVIAAKKQKLEESLLSIAREHSEYFTKREIWDNYAKENQLPLSGSYCNYFGSWHTTLQTLDLPSPIRKTQRKTGHWDKSSLIEVAKEHAEFFTSSLKWSEHAMKNNLPTCATFSNHFGSWNQAKKEIGVSAVTLVRYSNEELIEIALLHKEAFTSLEKWGLYSVENNLPRGITYHNRFKSWRNAKIAVEEEYNKRKLTE